MNPSCSAFLAENSSFWPFWTPQKGQFGHGVGLWRVVVVYRWPSESHVYSLGIAPASVEIVTKTLEKSDIDNKFVRTRTKKQKGGRTKRAGAQVK